MAYELVIGLNVIDEAVYQQYREAMRPILESYDGGFRYDFRVSEVLSSQADHKINRLFMIYFRDQAAREGFFSNSDYQKIRKQFFDPSVRGSTVISSYETG